MVSSKDLHNHRETGKIRRKFSLLSVTMESATSFSRFSLIRFPAPLRVSFETVEPFSFVSPCFSQPIFADFRCDPMRTSKKAATCERWLDGYRFTPDLIQRNFTNSLPHCSLLLLESSNFIFIDAKRRINKDFLIILVDWWEKKWDWGEKIENRFFF